MLSKEQIEAAEKIAYVDPSIVRAAMTRVPPFWRFVAELPNGGAFRRGNVNVIYTVARYGDGKIWYHVSASASDSRGEFRLPTYEEFKQVKNDFLGDRWAYQVFPPEKDYVNINPHVLHLYALMDEKESVLPDFTWGLGTI